MLDYRYHALSLAAVLLALAVGIVIGVAIGDSNLVSSAKSGIVHDLSSEVNDARRQAGQLQTQLTAEEAFSDDLYPLAVHGLLAGRSVGLVFLGGASDRVNSLVGSTVTQAGGDLTTVVGVREPLDLPSLAREAGGSVFAALGADGSHSGYALVERFGVIVGRQLVSGGTLVDRELVSRVRAGLFGAFDGQLSKLDGLVVMRSEPSGMTTGQTQFAAAFQSGLLDGAAAVGVPIVGVELTSTVPSQVPWYQSKNISSTDDLQATAGQAALVYALDGSHGAYGTKPSADSLLPNIGAQTAQPPAGSAQP
jgi:Copper transport outer membrane protein, MctB